MTPTPDAHRLRRNAVSAAVLAAGLVAAAVIRLTATPPPPDPLGDQAATSKKYLREMERFGGKANVVASEYREWFDGLWQGKRLAGTVAVLSVLLAAILFVALTPLPPADRPPSGEKREPTRPSGP